MRRSFIILLTALLASAAVFFAAKHVASNCCVKAAAQSADDLDWLRMEFRLTDAEMARVRQLHEGYLPKCHEFCAKIDASRQDLQALLSQPKADPSLIEQKLVEIGTLRGRCQSAMLQHFRQVSEVMPAEQGRRYLAEMERLTLGAHEQFEHSMSSAVSSPHGHHQH